MKAILSLIISGALVVSGHSQTRNVLVGTNNAVVQPTNFWSVDASNARTGLGLGTAATNPASAFQPSSATLSNLASSNAVNLTNLQATNLVGVIPSSNIPSTTLTNISGTLAIVSGGTGATNASNARVNLGATTVGNNLFTATTAEAARTAIGTLATNGDAINLTNFPTLLLRTNGSAAGLTNFPASLLITNGNGSGLTNLTAANITGTVALASNVTGTIAVSNGGTGTTNAATARTNLGLGATWLTNTNVTNFRTEIGLGAASLTPVITNITNTANVTLNSERALDVVVSTFGGWSQSHVITLPTNNPQNGDIVKITYLRSGGGNTPITVTNADSTGGPWYIYIGNEARWVYDSNGAPPRWQSLGRTVRSQINYLGDTASDTRVNLGLGWSALTNSNAGTSLVSVNTSGEVVSPTNFWQVAPINTRVQYSQPVVNATNAATNARNLYLYSLAISTTGVTNTITLPTNTATFLGDVATVIHEGPTSSVTAVRQLGSSTNLITLNQLQEAVKFIYNGGGWGLADNVSYVEPIYFSGTNAAANAAASRTNLGLGSTNSVVFGGGFTNNVGVGVGGSNIGLASDGDLGGRLGLIRNGNIIAVLSDNDPFFGLYYPITFQGGNAASNAATTRTNLGLGETNNVTFSNVTASGTLTATSTVTAKTNLVVEGFVDFTTNHTNATPVTPNTPARWLQIRVGTNVFYLPAHQ